MINEVKSEYRIDKLEDGTKRFHVYTEDLSIVKEMGKSDGDYMIKGKVYAVQYVAVGEHSERCKKLFNLLGLTKKHNKTKK